MKNKKINLYLIIILVLSVMGVSLFFLFNNILKGSEYSEEASTGAEGEALVYQSKKYLLCGAPAGYAYVQYTVYGEVEDYMNVDYPDPSCGNPGYNSASKDFTFMGLNGTLTIYRYCKSQWDHYSGTYNVRNPVSRGGRISSAGCDAYEGCTQKDGYYTCTDFYWRCCSSATPSTTTYTLKVYHYQKGTTTTVPGCTSPQTSTINQGVSYSTSACSPSAGWVYDSTSGDSTSGTMNGNKTVNYYYRRAQGNLVVNHYILDENGNKTTTTVPGCSSSSSTHDYGYNYSTSVCSSVNANYTNVSSATEGSTSGTINAATTTVNYYYQLKKATVTTHHYEINDSGVCTTNRVHNDDTQTVFYTKPYTTTTYDRSALIETSNYANDGKYKNNYRYKEMKAGSDPASVTSTDRASYEVIYCYERIPADITVSHVELGTSRELCQDVFTNTFWGLPYTTSACSDILSKYSLHSTTGDDTSGTISKDHTAVVYRYTADPAQVIVHHKICSTDATVHADVTINSTFDATYNTSALLTSELDSPYTGAYEYDGNRPVNASGQIETNPTEVTYCYKVRSAEVITHHVDDETGNPLCDDESQTKNYEETYTTSACQALLTNYTYDTPPNATGPIEQDLTEVTYRYKHRIATINVHHYLVDSTTKVYDDSNFEKNYGDNYNVHHLDSYQLYEEYRNKYQYKDYTSDPENSSVDGTVSNPTYDFIFYYEASPATIKVYHYASDTGDELCDPITSNTSFESNYQYDKCTNLSNDNYEFYTVISDDDESVINESNVTGTVNKAETIIKYFYSLKKANLTVHHYLMTKDGIKTTIKVHDDETTTKTYGESYEVFNAYSEDLYEEYRNYVYKDTDGDSRIGVVEKDDIVVNFYYQPNTVNLTVHHYREGTTQEICPKEEDVLVKDSTYTKTKCNILEYNFVKVNKNNVEVTSKNGTITDKITEDTVLDFYYIKKDNSLTSTIRKTGTQKIDKLNQEIEYVINYQAQVSDYRGDGIITIIDTLPYRIDSKKSNLDGGTYDGNYQITWSIPWKDIDTYNNKNDKIEVNKHIKVFYIDIPKTDEVLANNVEAKTNLNGKVDYATSSSDTNINVPGKIIIHHYIEGTNERLFDDDISIGNINDKYTSSSHEKEGYVLVTKPDPEVHTYQVEEQEFIYTYRKLKYNIKTKVIGGNGKITGDEEVYYNDDSTPNKIVITPNKGYQIKSIIIDGEEINVTNPDKMIIDNFKDVKDDHLVQVSFIEKIVPVPKTGINSKYTAISIIIILTTIFIFLKKDLFLKIFNKF